MIAKCGPGTAPLNIIRSNSKLMKFVEKIFKHKKTLYIPRQVCCLGMRKFPLWSDRCKWRMHFNRI